MRKVLLLICFSVTTLFGENAFLGNDVELALPSKDVLQDALDKWDRVEEVYNEWEKSGERPTFTGTEREFHPERLVNQKPEGKIFNPVTDVCWKCLFPMHIAGVEFTPGQGGDLNYHFKWPCFCTKNAKWGLPMSFWKPYLLIEVTPTPGKIPTLGGITVGNPRDYLNRGAISMAEGKRTSYYNVHYLPIGYLQLLLGRIPGLGCLKDKSDLPPPWFTELDPTWRDPKWSLFMTPKMFLHADVHSQAQCIEDCKASTAHQPVDDYHWCAGCHGSLYPFVGHVAHHLSAIQASSLIVQRALGKLHLFSFGRGFAKDNYCKQKKIDRLLKSMYKTQLILPVPDLKAATVHGKSVYCHPLGASDAEWGAGKSFPKEGEHFVYLVWKKMNCCVDLTEFIPGKMAYEEAAEAAAVAVESEMEHVQKSIDFGKVKQEIEKQIEERKGIELPQETIEAIESYEKAA